MCVYAASALASTTTAFPDIAGGWAKELTRRLLSTVLPEEERSLSINAPPGCEVVLNRKDGRLVINLINHYAGHPDYLPASRGEVTLGPFDVVLRTDVSGAVRARVEPDGPEVPTAVEDGAIRLTVPAFEVHQVISVTPEAR